MPLLVCLVLLALCPLAAQVTRPKDVRELAKGGSDAIPQLAPLLKNPSVEIRVEAVKAIVEIGTQHSLDPLIAATSDADPEIQIRATDGLVNFYVPGYVRTGLSGRLQRAGQVVKAKFTDTNDQVIPGFVQVRPDVIAALGKLARGGISMDSRANAARAVGILRGQAAIPDLLDAMKSKDDSVLYESLIAIQKIRDRSAGPKIRYLLRDLNEKVQISAIETTGILQNEEALPDLVNALNRASSQKVKRAALTAIAMVPSESSRPIFTRFLDDKDDGLRGAAAEGFGRLKNPADKAMLEKAFEQPGKASPRLSIAFALVSLGTVERSEFSPLQLLINTLNNRSRQGEAFALLVELARDSKVRAELHPAMAAGTKDEKIYLARALARSGDQDSVASLEKLSHDGDGDVAQEGLRALQTLRARL
jgi:HEAT repeat protein